MQFYYIRKRDGSDCNQCTVLCFVFNSRMVINKDPNSDDEVHAALAYTVLVS